MLPILKIDAVLITEFLGLEVKPNIADWSKYDHLGITDAMDEFCGDSFVHIPKGEGQEWFRVMHRGIPIQLFTDQTYAKIHLEDIEDLYGGKRLEDLKYHQSFDALLPVFKKINELGYNTEIIYDKGIPSLHLTYMKLLDIIIYYKNDKDVI